MKPLTVRFARDERAATTAEFGLIVAGIGLAIASVVLQVGPQLGRFVSGVIARLGGG
ncbi:MAG: Flp family type IVb pilin [Hyphomicrobiales bacterium]